MLWRKVLLAAEVLLLCASSAVAEPGLVVLPIDRAKFLGGQKFDMEVELRGAKADEIEVLLNGKDAAAFFKATPVVKKEDALSSFRMNGVTFLEPGPVKVEVQAKAGGKTFEANVGYTVVGPEKRTAKNVILFIGDGMGLVSRQVARILSKGITQGKYNGLL